MRDDTALLLDMLIAARKVECFVAELALSDFVENEMVQSAVIRELQVIGEAARMITPKQEIHTQKLIGELFLVCGTVLCMSIL